MLCCGSLPTHPRVQIVMKDESKTPPHFLCTWHMFLPSEVQLGSQDLGRRGVVPVHKIETS